jgi:uncharacterized membrane protein
MMAALNVIHSLRTRGLRRTLLFAALGNGLPILGELVAVHILRMLRHHVRPQVKGVPLAIALGWYNVGYGTLAIVNGIIYDSADPHHSRESLALAFATALAATSFDLLLDPFGLELGLWEWGEGGSYAPEIKGSNGKRGIPLLNFAGWITLSTSVILAYHRLRTRGDADVSDSQNGRGSDAERAAALLLLSYYLPAAVWALKRGRRKYLLYSAPFATTLCAALKGRSAAS